MLAATFLLLALAVPPDPQGCAQTLDPASRAAFLARRLSGADELVADDGRLLHVALAFHVVRASDGTGGIRREQLTAALGDAGRAFARARIAFELLHVDTIESDELVTIETSEELAELRRTNVVPGALNVYFVDELFFGTSCGVSAYTTLPVQGVVMADDCTGTPQNPSTFPHEIAHYFDVFHTYDAIGGFECVSGSNCRVAGDLLCDTAAAPEVLTISDLTHYPLCAYVGTHPPPCAGDPPYDPDLTNYMSAGPPKCRDHFTLGQLQRARATLLRLRTDLLLPAPEPAAAREDCAER